MNTPAFLFPTPFVRRAPRLRSTFSKSQLPVATATDPRPPTTTTAPPTPSAPQQRIPQPELLTPTTSRLTKTRTGILLVNIGTPASLSIPDVREYLKQFLGDQRVVDLNPLAKWFILNLFILRTRPKESAEAYATIWDKERGSPLLYHSQDLARKLEKLLDNEDKYVVRVGMQYCEPNLKDVMKEMRDKQGVDNIVVIPMYPQYASSATGAALELVYKEASSIYATPFLRVVPPFYAHRGYVEAYAEVIERVIGKECENFDHLLMSFHGVPVTHCEKTDSSEKVCGKMEGCCRVLRTENRNCYRAQAFESARLLAGRLGLRGDQFSVAFQSRLAAAGPVWIQPYTDFQIKELAKKGVKRLAVVVPSFTADCLETLEEIGVRGKEDFLEAGGEELKLIPCLNSEDIWAKALLDIIKDSCPFRDV